MAHPLDLRSLRRNPHIVVASLCTNLLGLALPLVMIQVYDRIIPKEGYATLAVLALGLAVAAIGDLIIRIARGHLTARATARFEAEAYCIAFRRVLQSGTAFDALDSGTLHDRVESIERVRRHHGSEVSAAMMDLPFIVLFLAVMTLISPLLGLTVATLAGASMVVVRFQRSRIIRLNEDRQMRDQRRHSFLVETIEGVEMVKGLGIEDLLQRRYERLIAGNATITEDLNARVNLTQGITSAVGLMAPVITAGVGSFQVIQGQMSVGAVAATVLLTGRIIQPMLRIEALMAGEADIRRSEEDVRELLDTETNEEGTTQIGQIDEIALHDANIAPRVDVPAVLKNVSFRLRKGDCVALLGPDGSGRSLLLSALAGQLRPVDGDLTYNNVPIGHMHHDVLEDRVGLMSPGSTMLEGTLLENITAFETQRNQHQAFRLAQELGIDDFIARHPDGLSMRIAARTSSSLPRSIHDAIILISGMVREPDVILFDEANAGLDRAIDKNLVEMFRKRLPNTIIVMVTHRPSYLALANRVLRLEDGHIIEEPVQSEEMALVG